MLVEIHGLTAMNAHMRLIAQNIQTVREDLV